LSQVCLIRETKKTRSVGVPPGTGLGNTALDDQARVACVAPDADTLKKWTNYATLEA